MNVFFSHSTELHHAFESDHKILLPNGTIFQLFLVKNVERILLSLKTPRKGFYCCCYQTVIHKVLMVVPLPPIIALFVSSLRVCFLKRHLSP